MKVAKQDVVNHSTVGVTVGAKLQLQTKGPDLEPPYFFKVYYLRSYVILRVK